MISHSSYYRIPEFEKFALYPLVLDMQFALYQEPLKQHNLSRVYNKRDLYPYHVVYSRYNQQYEFASFVDKILHMLLP